MTFRLVDSMLKETANRTTHDLFRWKSDTPTILPETHLLNAWNKGEKYDKLKFVALSAAKNNKMK